MRLLLNAPLVKIIIVSPKAPVETKVVEFEAISLAEKDDVAPDAIGFLIFNTLN